MKKVIICLEKKFKKEEPLIKKSLAKLEKILQLEKEYVEVYLVGDKFMRKNVLSFPAPKNFPQPEMKKWHNLGEIYLNPKFIKEQGSDLAYMLVHGLLHLLGYDHKKESDRIKMEKKEAQLWRQIKY